MEDIRVGLRTAHARKHAATVTKHELVPVPCLDLHTEVHSARDPLQKIETANFANVLSMERTPNGVPLNRVPRHAGPDYRLGDEHAQTRCQCTEERSARELLLMNDNAKFANVRVSIEHCALVIIVVQARI